MSAAPQPRDPSDLPGWLRAAVAVALARAVPRVRREPGGVLVLSPILSDVADDFGVSAGRGGAAVIAAPLAVVAALAAGRLLTRFSPRALLGAGSAPCGRLARGAQPRLVPLLALAQVPMWVGISTVLTAGVAATASWTEPGAASSSPGRSPGRPRPGSSACP